MRWRLSRISRRFGPIWPDSPLLAGRWTRESRCFRLMLYSVLDPHICIRHSLLQITSSHQPIFRDQVALISKLHRPSPYSFFDSSLLCCSTASSIPAVFSPSAFSSPPSTFLFFPVLSFAVSFIAPGALSI
jgi:hypothetical protein